MNSGSDSRRRDSNLARLTYVLLAALVALSALTLHLIETRLAAGAGRSVALTAVAVAILPLSLLVCTSARRLHHEWVRAAEREDWLGATLKGIADGVISTDTAGRITFLNPAAERFTAWTDAEARGRPVGEVLQLRNRKTNAHIEDPAAAALRDDPAAAARTLARLAARDGTERTVACDARPVRSGKGDVIGCVVVIRDLTGEELADAALQASQEMFATITEHISDMIAVLDLQGRRLYNSASYARLLAPPGDLYLTDSFASIHPEDRDSIRRIFEKTIETGVGQRAEYRLLASDGSIVFIESLGSVIRGPDGRPERILVVSRDCTERRRAEKRVQQEKEFSDTLISSMPGVFYLCDERRRLLRWNRNLETVTQYSAEEIASFDPARFFPADQESLVQSRFMKCLQHGRADIEVPLVARDGTRTPFYFTGVRVQIEGRPCMLGVGIDIGERVRAEESARATMRRLGRQNRALSEHAHASVLREKDLASAFRTITELAATTIEVSRAGIWLYSEEGDAIRCEDSYEESRKKHSRGAELRAREFPAYLAALAEERAIAAHDAQNDPRTSELRDAYLAPQGITSLLDAPIRSGARMIGVVCHEHIGPVRTWTPDEQNFAGSIADLVALSLEVHQRQQAEAALREARDNLELKVAERTRDLAAANERLLELDRLKSEFLAMMSHELRTPLNSIIGFTGILRQGLAGPLNEEQLKQLGMVHFSARHLLGLINDLLDLSRIESGKMEVSVEDFQLEEVVQEVVQSLAPTAQQKKLTLETRLDPPQLPLHTDRKKTFQILLNLANNALKFTERGGVRIEAAAAAGKVSISVIDTGIGIREESIPGLFQAFRQVDGSARRVYEGTGLGLYLCRKLSSMLGGSIRAESQFGIGSRFVVTFPTHLPSTTRPS